VTICYNLIKLTSQQLGTWDDPPIVNPELLNNVIAYGKMVLILYIWPPLLQTYMLLLLIKIPKGFGIDAVILTSTSKAPVIKLYWVRYTRLVFLSRLVTNILLVVVTKMSPATALLAPNVVITDDVAKLFVIFKLIICWGFVVVFVVINWVLVIAPKPLPNVTPAGNVIFLLNIADQGLNVMLYSVINPAILYTHSLVSVCAISGDATPELNKNVLVFADGTYA